MADNARGRGHHRRGAVPDIPGVFRQFQERREFQQPVGRAAALGVPRRADWAHGPGHCAGHSGLLFVQAGQQSRASAVGSTGDAFDFLAAMGPVVLGAVAAGLVAYGIYMLVQAKYPILRGI
ncbi:DUF1206 domain-containing protein [Hymenobacter humi]|uniref:DUF1206 domain-containing protein n=1 Tax=Hymenobacter humi TaxID=1411620 RepID=A0ABW2U181_9BACT